MMTGLRLPNPLRFGAVACLFFSAIAVAPCAFAGPFEIAAIPSRFEVSAKPGQRLGQSLEIQNVGGAPTEVALRTIDWTYSEAGDITYHDELIANSCRPWVTLERKLLKLGGGEKKTFRFQVEPPADAPRGECRFMLAIEGLEPASKALIQQGGVGLSLPVSGRIAVAIYVAVGGAEPKFEVIKIGTQDAKDAHLAAVTVRNVGDAHGRLDGALDATDANGQTFQLVPDGTPVLPGQTRSLVLTPKAETGGKLTPPAFPLRVKGSLDWDDGSFKFNTELK